MSSPGRHRWLGAPLPASAGRPTYTSHEGEEDGTEPKGILLALEVRDRWPSAGNGWERGGSSDGRVSDLLSGREPAGRPAMARPAPSRRVLVGCAWRRGSGEVSGPGSRICASPAVAVWG